MSCNVNVCLVVSLAVLVAVVSGAGPPPAEQEVAERKAEHERQAQPHVVRHKDQHQHVGERRLNHVHQSLGRMPTAEHALSEIR